MLIWKCLLMGGGLGMILAAAGILTYDSCTKNLPRRSVAPAGAVMAVRRSHWRISLALALLAWGPILIAVSLLIVTTDISGMHVSEMPGQNDVPIAEMQKMLVVTAVS